MARLYLERKKNKKGWVAYPFSAGRPLDLSKIEKSNRNVVVAPTRAEAVKGCLELMGFKATE